MPEVKLEASWKSYLGDEFAAEYMQNLSKFLRAEKAAGRKIYPPGREIFYAFSLTPFDSVKVVILGQDPYWTRTSAWTQLFCTPRHHQTAIPNRQSDLGIQPPINGNLESWAKSGVLLLNSCLTVADGQAASHAGKGWERFTDAAIDLLNMHKHHLVFAMGP